MRRRVEADASTSGPETKTVQAAWRPRRSQRFWRLPAAVLVAVVFGMGGGLAFAYETATGTGTGHASVLVVKDGVITAPVTATPSLVPGGPGTLSFTITNPNPVGVTLDEVTSVTVTSKTACASYLTVVTLTSITPMTPPRAITPAITVPAKTSSTETLDGLLDGLVALKITAPSTCQGKTFTVTLVLSGKTS